MGGRSRRYESASGLQESFHQIAVVCQMSLRGKRRAGTVFEQPIAILVM
ncbi:MAG: hypothetical protein KatS3mg111_2062 [Pirellulaceae bacterium]|nr:MAG: hypothetical protein KatS3mg111_2062 [Pirellulaceae bacterium]